MVERTILTLLAVAGLACLFVIVDTVLSLWFDEEMRPKTEPAPKPLRSVPPYPPENRFWNDCILCGKQRHHGPCHDPEPVS